MIEISNPKELYSAPVVSVVMLAYNHQDYIEQAIEGVLSQVFAFPIELIVAEDCSTDATRTIAQKYVGSHPHCVRIITGESNVGMMPNFFRALEHCRGEFIGLCEGDDWWCDPIKVHLQVDLLRQNPEMGMVHTDFRNATLRNNIWCLDVVSAHHGVAEAALSGDMFAILLRKLSVRTCTTIYRKQVIDKFLSSPLANPHYSAGDLPLALYCAANWKIGYIDRVMSVYRIAPGSVTRSGLSSTVKFMEGVADIFRDLRLIYGNRHDFTLVGEKSALSIMAKAAFRAGDIEALNRALRRREEVDPASRLLLPFVALKLVTFFPMTQAILNRLINSLRLLRQG
ncbi:MAG: glycosyltransferase [Methylocystis sp.]|uniref:glycosyltransferase n=1 Tax=Methylocystis sp. TaxID=1911079 RepID=UPI003DA46B73